MLNKTHIQFIVWFGVIFTLTFSGLYILGLIPSELADTSGGVLGQVQDNLLNQVDTTSPSSANAATIEASSSGPHPVFHGETPTHITIPVIGVDATIANPVSTNADVLDNDLTHGAVHYPGSGLLADGNVYIFGHSTNWPVVQNQAYKTFNKFSDLKAGDLIEVTGTSHVYSYKVVSVVMEDADEAWVDLSDTKPMLTLSTCNTFGEKQQRYVVTAEYVSDSAIN